MNDKLRDAAQQALEDLVSGGGPYGYGKGSRQNDTIAALRAALAETPEVLAEGNEPNPTAGMATASATTPKPDSRTKGATLCFVVRKSDGQFLRGARFWTWTKNWRRAAVLSPDVVRGYCLGERFGIRSMDDIELYPVQLPNRAERRGEPPC